MAFSRISIFLVFFIALTACGKKGPVRPKLLPLPAKPQGFAVEQRGEGLLLSWEIPQQNQDGTPLTDLAAFRVERLRYEPGTECIDCLNDFAEVARIDLDYPGAARRLGDRLLWRDPEPQPPGGYVYRVTPVTGGGREGAAARTHRPLLPLPAPPEELTASAHDRMARLAWRPAETEAVPLWNVYRWLPGEEPPLAPVNDRPLEQPAFESFGLENGQTYLFGVTTLIRQEDWTAESYPAGPVSVTPESGR